MAYEQLHFEERETLALGLCTGLSLRTIAQSLGRAASTLSRELRRNATSASAYRALAAQRQAAARTAQPRRAAKLRGNALSTAAALWAKVLAKLRRRWSPEQISRWLQTTYADQPELQVSHQTIYRALWLLPKGELKRALLAGLRQQGKQRARSAGAPDCPGKPWVHQLIHARPPDALAREALGHFEADLIIGQAAKTAAVGVLLERTSRRVRLVKLERRDAYSAYQGFAGALARVPAALCQTLTYDQGAEMAEHARLTAKTGIAVYFCQPHSPWQRGGVENINGLIRQYLPKGRDLTDVAQAHLDAVAKELNTRPRRVLNWQTPLQVWHRMLAGMSFSEAVALGG
jgi:transposase, IS30 family